jgi:hypothetical protein
MLARIVHWRITDVRVCGDDVEGLPVHDASHNRRWDQYDCDIVSCMTDLHYMTPYFSFLFLDSSFSILDVCDVLDI